MSSRAAPQYASALGVRAFVYGLVYVVEVDEAAQTLCVMFAPCCVNVMAMEAHSYIVTCPSLIDFSCFTNISEFSLCVSRTLLHNSVCEGIICIANIRTGILCLYVKTKEKPPQKQIRLYLHKSKRTHIPNFNRRIKLCCHYYPRYIILCRITYYQKLFYLYTLF